MKALSYSQIQEFINKADLTILPSLHISILRNIVIEPIKPYLCYFAYKMNFNAKIKFGEYNNIFQEAVGGRDDLFCKDTNYVMIFMNLDILSNDLVRNYNSLTIDQIQAEINRVKDHIKQILHGIRGQTDAMILWHGFELPIYPALGIWDSQLKDGQIGTINKLNDFLREILRNTPNAYFVNLNLCMCRLGSNNFYDLRYWHIGRAPYSREALREIAFEDFKFIRPLMGKNRKCLVLDCDDTLWGGIVGEDGLAGIRLAKTYPGSEFYEFQQEIVNLYHRGIIIALCSKNNEEDVWEVFRKHPDMVLKKEHIATARINWQDKVSNLYQIASDLNIGLDSLVFVDNSEFEANLVRQELPEVEVINLPKGRAVEYRNYLASCGFFDTLTITVEDKNRGAMYKVEADRKQLKTQTTDIVSYYKSLEMVVTIRFADEFSTPRIAQQTQKTNQFNLTTRRYNEADIKRFIDNPNIDVICLELADKYGDLGIVGTCVLRYENQKAMIDTFLLSCRVLGRGAEDVFLVKALQLAKRRGCKLVVGEYLKTKKNEQVESFYSQRAFSEIGSREGDVSRFFHFELDQPFPKKPDYFKGINSCIEED